MNYDFPPNRGIGGRRWAKFSSQLVAEGYKVYVIKADPLKGFDDSAWSDDVASSDIHVTSLPRKYPVAFSHPGSNLFSKILYRYHKWKLENSVAGTIYDLSIGWQSVLAPAFRKIMREKNITNVIATGAPWQMLVDICRLKQEFPKMHLITDFRDPWLSAKNYGMEGLSGERRKEEEYKQAFVLENSDIVTTPAAHITAELKQWASERCARQARFELLSHFYDPNDYSINIARPTDRSDKLTFIYGGDLYLGLQPQLELLRSQILHLKKNRPELYQKLDIRIYTNTPDFTFRDIDKVHVAASIGKKLNAEIALSDFCLVLLPDNKRNDMTTKFIEYFPFRKPMIVVASEGEATRFVTQHGIGIQLNPAKNTLENIMDRYIAGESLYNHNFDFSAYSLPNVTRQLISYFR